MASSSRKLSYDELGLDDQPVVSKSGPLAKTGPTRKEKDFLGERDVPVGAYYGIHTMRAVDNYQISGVLLRFFPPFVKALAEVKKACALANHRLNPDAKGGVPTEMKDAICQACDELIQDPSTVEDEEKRVLMQSLRNSFVVDMVQGGAGTSTNMNANEVIANRALEIMGKEKGDYVHCHPNDHVNKSQSTNDTYPTAAKIAIHHMHEGLVTSMAALRDAFAAKGREFSHVVKMGRTQLQDAVPMTLGQEFHAYATTIDHDFPVIRDAALKFGTCNLGGTAIGTKIAADPRFAETAVEELRKVTGLPMELAIDLVEASSSVGSMIFFSGVLRRVAVKISKICNDLRLMSSGPRCGLSEINLPEMAAGSSIMPGKVNPIIPEVMSMCAFQVIGFDQTVVMGAQAGQLELNVFEPVIILSIFRSIRMLTNGMDTLRTRCVEGITANVQRCHDLAYGSIGIVTALLPIIGYKNASNVATKALHENRPVAEIVVEMGLMDKKSVDEALDAEKMAGLRADVLHHKEDPKTLAVKGSSASLGSSDGPDAKRRKCEPLAEEPTAQH